VTVPRGQYGSLAASLEIPGIIKAPLAAGQNLGKIVLKLGETPLLEQPLTVIKPVEEGGWFKRLLDAVRLFFLQLFGGDGAGKS
jgi:D-alanyl-D-alanine carboxypeptidase (penicillin-binding protein 5/6)